jgi:hypothetical protein
VTPVSVTFRFSLLAMPKSISFTVPSDVSIMFAGWMSRWITPFLCAHASADSTCEMHRTASPQEQATLPQTLIQAHAFHQFHNHEELVFETHGGVQRRDIGVIEPRSEP